MPFWLLLSLSLGISLPLAHVVVTLRTRGRGQRAARFQRKLSHELLMQASALDRLVVVLGEIADNLDAERVLRQACGEVVGLVEADCAVLFASMADDLLRPVDAAGVALREVAALAVETPEDVARRLSETLQAPVAHAVRLSANGELVGVLAVCRSGEDPLPFSQAALAQLHVLADFSARAAQNARLVSHLDRLRDEAERRERERARLSNRLAEAEQSERRRLAMLLHDGPQQTITSAALMLDACLDALAEGESVEVHRMLAMARQRNREAVRDLRELGWSLEPAALREQGLTAAVIALADKLGTAHAIAFRLDLTAAERLEVAQQTFVYQIVREAIANAVKHARPRTIAVSATLVGGALYVTIADDGPGLDRSPANDGLSQGIDTMRERAAALGGTIEWRRSTLGGVEVVLAIPTHSLENAAAA
jgi:signal transduction histidine kinase